MLVFGERGKPEYPGKNLSEQSSEPTNSTHIWRPIRESNLGHIGGRPVLSPLRQHCSQCSDKLGQTRGFNKCSTNVLEHRGQNFTTAVIAIWGYVQILCGNTTRFSFSILNIEGTFAHSAIILRLIHSFFQGFLRGFHAVHEESLIILLQSLHRQCAVMFVYILLRSYWIVIWSMWNADLTPREGLYFKLNSSRAGSLFLVPFFSLASPARVFRAYKWACSQARPWRASSLASFGVGKWKIPVDEVVPILANMELWFSCCEADWWWMMETLLL